MWRRSQTAGFALSGNNKLSRLKQRRQQYREIRRLTLLLQGSARPLADSTGAEVAEHVRSRFPTVRCHSHRKRYYSLFRPGSGASDPKTGSRLERGRTRTNLNFLSLITEEMNLKYSTLDGDVLNIAARGTS